MDYILDILVQKHEINKLNLSELLVEWGGEEFSQDPPRYISDSKILFCEYKDSEYYKEFIGNLYPVEMFIALHLEGTLLDLEMAVNGDKEDFFNNEIVLFLDNLFQLEKFVILLIRDEECVDEKYKISSKKELHNIIYNSLNWSSPKGVLITKA